MEKTTLELLREAAQILQVLAKEPTGIPVHLNDLPTKAKAWLENAPLACLGLPENPQQIPLEGV